MRRCPSKAFSEEGGEFYNMDMERCIRHHLVLKDEHHWPCGICIDVCPVGRDLDPYRGSVREGHRRGQGALLQARLVTGRPPINIGDRGYGTEATR